MGNFYVYIHRRATDSSIFYVGKGRGKRSNKYRGRSEWWKRTVEKHGLIVEIAQSNMIEEDAFLLESWLIAKFRHEGIPLVNMTDGGEGCTGLRYTDKRRNAAKARMRGKGIPRKTIEAAILANSKEVATRCGKIFSSISEAARYCNPENPKSAKSSISGVLRGKAKNAYGYEWGKIVDGEFRSVYKRADHIALKGTYKVKISCGNGMVF